MANLEQHSCYHCGEEIPKGFNASLDIKGDQAEFCCYGCMAVAEMIISGGLENFYQHRTELAEKPQELDQQRLSELKLFDDDSLQSEFSEQVEVNGKALKQARLSVSGITCAACIWLLEKEVNRIEGVHSFSVNHTTHKAILTWDASEVLLSETLLRIHRLGYQSFPYDEDRAKQNLEKERKNAMFRIAVAGIATMQNMMFSVPLYLGIYSGIDQDFLGFFRWVSLLMALPVVSYAAFPFYRAAWNALKVRQLNMDVPVSLAILLAFSASAYITAFTEPSLESDVYFDSVAMFAFFLLLGRFMEMQTRHRHLNSDAEMNQLLPATATLAAEPELNLAERSVAAHKLNLGDHIVVKQGQIAPADGLVIQGHSRFDESALTGEYLPLEKTIGDKISAGTANVENTVVLEVSATGNNSRIGAIIKLLDSALADKPETIKLTDRIASYFVGFVLLASGSAGLYWHLEAPSHAFAIMLSVLVVTCPCALSLATPTALTAANTALRKLGFLITKGHVLEAMSATTDIIFDKTGTLTEGRLELQKVTCFGAHGEQEVLAIVAALEAHSSHPIAKVFEPYASAQADSVETVLGQGIKGEVQGQHYRLGTLAFSAPSAKGEPKASLASINDTEHTGHSIYLSAGNTLIAEIKLRDKIRAEAKACVSALQHMGMRVHILSGDHQSSVQHTGTQLGIDSLHWGQSPEQKLAYVNQLQAQGAQVTMIGDGINDLPVLSGARLSIAMGRASDLTKLNSDAILLNEHLQVLEQAFDKAHKGRTIIKQNISWALGYNLLMLPLAAAGWVPPYFAALGMSLSSLIVVFNSLRLRR